MNKIIIWFLIGFLFFVSCGNSNDADTRLRGTWFEKNVNRTSELRFRGNTLREIIKQSDGKNYDFSYKLKFILMDNNGGAFYAISSYKNDDAFDIEKERDRYIYVFERGGLTVQKLSGSTGWTFDYNYIKK